MNKLDLKKRHAKLERERYEGDRDKEILNACIAGRGKETLNACIAGRGWTLSQQPTIL